MRPALPIALLLAACGGEPEPTDAEKIARDEAKIAAVKQAQDIPPEPVTLQPIAYSEIEKHDLLGASCAFGSEDESPGALVLAMDRGAFIKVDGELMRLAPDPGSPELPLGARGKYDGKEHSLILDVAEGEGEQQGIETTDFPARLTVRNRRDQVVYAASGKARCGS